jgi:hypothetical protein
VVHLHMLWEQYLLTLMKKRMPFRNDYSGHSACACSAVRVILERSRWDFTLLGLSWPVDAQLVGSCDRDTESRDNKLT